MLTETDRKIIFRYKQPWDKMPNWIQCQQQKSNSKEEETRSISAAFITHNNTGKERLFLNISTMSNSSQSKLRIISKGIEKEKYN